MNTSKTFINRTNYYFPTFETNYKMKYTIQYVTKLCVLQIVNTVHFYTKNLFPYTTKLEYATKHLDWRITSYSFEWFVSLSLPALEDLKPILRFLDVSTSTVSFSFSNADTVKWIVRLIISEQLMLFYFNESKSILKKKFVTNAIKKR